MISPTEEQTLGTQLNGFNAIDESEKENTVLGPNIEPTPQSVMVQSEPEPEVTPPQRSGIQIGPTNVKPQFDYSSIWNPQVDALVPRETEVPELTPDGSIWEANLANNSSWGYFMNNRAQRDYKLVDLEKFNPFGYIPADLQAYPGAYALDTNEDQVNETTAILRQEVLNNETIANHPWKSGIATFALGVIDPTNVIPGGLMYRNFKNSSRVMKAAQGAATSNAIATTMQEALLHESQLTRDTEESVWNVAAAAVLGGALGAGIGKFGEMRAKKVTRSTPDDAVKAYKGSEEYASKQNNIDMLREKVKTAPENERSTIQEEILAAEKEVETKLGQIYSQADIEIRSQSELTQGKMMLEPIDPRAYNKAHEDIVGMYEDRPIPMSKDGLLTESDLHQMPEWTQKIMFGSPLNRMKTGEFQTPKLFADLFIESNYNTVKHANHETYGSSVETNLKLITSENSVHLADMQQEFYNMLDIKGNYFKDTRAAFAGGDMGWDEFARRTAQAIITDKPDANANISKAARIFTDKIIKPITEELVEYGDLPEGITPKNAQAYFTVVYNKQKIIEQGGSQAWGPGTFPYEAFLYYKQVQNDIKAFKNSLFYKQKNKEIEVRKYENNIKETPDNIRKLNEERIEEIEAEIKAAYKFEWLDSDGKLREEVSDEVLEAQARQTTDKILAQQGDKLLNPIHDVLNSSPKQLKERAFLANQSSMTQFHIQDPIVIGELFVRAMAPRIAINRIARKNGFQNIEEMREFFSQSLKAEHDTKMKGKTGKEAAKLDKQFREATNDMRATIEILQGIYGQGANVLNNDWARLADNFRLYTAMRFLGGMVISSFSDVGVNVMRNGPYQFIHHGLLPVARSLNGVQRRDLRAIGRAVNSYIGGSIEAFIDRQGLTTSPGVISKSYNYLASSFGNATLMNQWDDTMQAFAGSISFNRVLDVIARTVEGKKVSNKDRMYVANLGLDSKYFDYIYSKTKDNIDPETGSRYADWTTWIINDKFEAQALTEFKAAILKDVDATAIKPGIADKPLIAHEQTGKFLFQFKAFALAATNKILYSGVQRRHDANTYTGIATMIAMGALSYVTSRLIRGEEPDYSFKNLSVEAIDRSGVLGIFAEVFNIGQKAGLIPGEGVSRYYSRGIVGSLVGPSLGSVDDMAYLLNRMKTIGVGDSELTTSDIQKAFRFAPYQNLLWFQGIQNQILSQISDKYGVDETRKGY